MVADVELRVDLSTLDRRVTARSPPRAVGRSGPARPAAVDSLFAGTYVVAGSGEAVAVRTGMETELGRITSLAQSTDRHESPLDREMARMTRVVAVLSVSIGVAFLSRGRSAWG
jgi:magnesium-transporting ATPase (P-type)